MSKKHPRLIELYHLLSYDEVDSTNEEAKRLARGGGAEGAVLWAKKQSNGRGRMGREWVSDEGNLFVSILLKPTVAAKFWPQLSFVASLAVHDAIQPMLADDSELRLKWPNDVLLGHRKVAGILLEQFTDDHGQQWVVVGVGVNVEHYPKRTLFPATCLTEHGIEIVSAKIVLSRFLSCFIHRYDQWIENGFTNTQKDWLARAYRLHDEVTVSTGEISHTGCFKGIDVSGHILLECDGVLLPLSAGDVSAEILSATE